MIQVASVHSCNSLPVYQEMWSQTILNRFWVAQISAGLCLLHNTTFHAICRVCSGGNPRYSPKVNGKSIRPVLPWWHQRNHFKEVILYGKNQTKLGSVVLRLAKSFSQVWGAFEHWNSLRLIPAAPFYCPNSPSPKIPWAQIRTGSDCMWAGEATLECGSGMYFLFVTGPDRIVSLIQTLKSPSKLGVWLCKEQGWFSAAKKPIWAESCLVRGCCRAGSKISWAGCLWKLLPWVETL